MPLWLAGMNNFVRHRERRARDCTKQRLQLTLSHFHKTYPRLPSYAYAHSIPLIRGRSFGACFQNDASWACLAGGERNNSERELRLPQTGTIS